MSDPTTSISTTRADHEGLPAMYLLEHQMADSRMHELRDDALAVSRARRLYLARRAALRAERAVRRAARASASVY